jgi:two-component system chemotaxis sensor kinase CheA
VTYEVDEVVGQQQIVIKKLGPEFQSLQGILGGAVLSNGEPSMILDLAELVELQMDRNEGGQVHAA